MSWRDEETAGRILDRLYELRDRDAIPDLLELSKGSGVRATIRAAESLNELGLLRDYERGEGPRCRGRLSALGARLHERFGGGRALYRRLSGADAAPGGGGETHYHGPVFLGDVGQSNVAFAGEGVSQQLVASAGPAAELLEELTRLVRQDRSLTPAKREEAAGDVKSVGAELEKARPNWKVVGYLLAGLGAIASAAEQVRKLKESLGLP